MTLTLTHRSEGTVSTLHFVDLSGAEIGPEVRRSRSDVATLVEVLKSHATGATHTEMYRQSSLTKMLHTEMKPTHLVRVVLCTEPRHAMQSLDLAAYMVGGQTVLCNGAGLPFEVGCALEAMGVELATFKDALRQQEFYRSARRLSFHGGGGSGSAANVVPRIDRMSSIEMHHAAMRAKDSQQSSRQMMASSQSGHLDAALKQLRRDHAVLQDETKAQVEVLETKCRRLSERALKIREERDALAAQLSQLDARFQEKWKNREGDFATELTALTAHAQDVVDRVNEERRKAPLEATTAARASRDRDAIAISCRELERKVFQKQLEETLRSRDDAMAGLKTMYEGLLAESNARVASLTASARRDAIRHKHDVVLCKAEIEYLFEYCRALTRVVHSTKSRAPPGLTLPTPVLEWQYLTHIRSVFKKVVVWLRENHNNSVVKDVEGCYDMARYPLAFIPTPAAAENEDAIEQIKRVLMEREKIGLL